MSPQFDFSDINQQLQRMAYVMMQNWLSKQSHERQRAYQEEQFRGWGEHQERGAEIETERLGTQHVLSMLRSDEDFRQYLAKQDDVKRLASAANYAESMGNQPIADSKRAQLNELVVKLAEDYERGMTTGAVGAPGLERMFTHLGEEERKTMLPQFMGVARQAKELPLRAGELELGREALVTRRGELGLAKEKEAKEPKEKWFTEMIQVTKDIDGYITAQGVEAADEPVERLTALEAMMVRSAKKLYPLKPATLGTVKTALLKVRLKLIDRKELTEDDREFLAHVVNLHKVSAGEAYIPETGMPAPSERVIHARTYETFLEWIMQDLGVDRAKAEWLLKDLTKRKGTEPIK